jgi:hypothetical protein
MKRLSVTLAAVCLAALIAAPRHAPSNASILSPAPPAAADFRPSCPRLPFQPIAQRNDLDRQCGINGDTEDAPHQAQNRAKNNFCSTGAPVPMTIARFITLQQRAADKLHAAQVKWGTRTDLPPDRSLLADVMRTPSGRPFGEGSIVTLVGFIVGARHSNVRKGESVNCTKKGGENNDIHIEVGEHRNDDACGTVTAEISPHFRPEAWEQFDDFEITNPVRFTGPLFFDASHRPCTAAGRANPARVSVWELHPVYDIAVCKSASLAVCRQNANNASMWWPFNEWVDLPDSEEINE